MTGIEDGDEESENRSGEYFEKQRLSLTTGHDETMYSPTEAVKHLRAPGTPR